MSTTSKVGGMWQQGVAGASQAARIAGQFAAANPQYLTPKQRAGLQQFTEGVNIAQTLVPPSPPQYLAQQRMQQFQQQQPITTDFALPPPSYARTTSPSYYEQQQEAFELGKRTFAPYSPPLAPYSQPPLLKRQPQTQQNLLATAAGAAGALTTAAKSPQINETLMQLGQRGLEASPQGKTVKVARYVGIAVAIIGTIIAIICLALGIVYNSQGWYIGFGVALFIAICAGSAVAIGDWWWRRRRQQEINKYTSGFGIASNLFGGLRGNITPQ